ncbi:MAG TPA: ParB/RepB/Spo0J family partition protein [Actinomycetota bacterium]|nr:ParB/RepB/Spo0J family partition protein [Actinomycetota bacterium]
MTIRTGLGRGLGALIPSGANALEELPTTSIVPNPGQPRRSFEDEAISDLAASIRQVGILQPVVVRPLPDGTYQLVVGERRWRAARRAGLTTVPALVIETDERGALERALVENVHRQDLNPLEEAAAYQQLVDEAGLTHEALAERLGLSRPAVSNALRLLELPAGIQRLVLDHRISAGHGRALLSLNGHPLQERVAQRVVAEGLSVRQTEELVREYRVDVPKAPPAPRRPRAALEDLGEALSEALATRVRVTMGKRKGWVVIECGSRDDLDRVCEGLLRQGGGEDEAAVAGPGSDGGATERTFGGPEDAFHVEPDSRMVPERSYEDLPDDPFS